MDTIISDREIKYLKEISKEKIYLLFREKKRKLKESQKIVKNLTIQNVSGSLPSENKINNKAVEFFNKRYYKESNPHDTIINDFKVKVCKTC